MTKSPVEGRCKVEASVANRTVDAIAARCTTPKKRSVVGNRRNSGGVCKTCVARRPGVQAVGNAVELVEARDAQGKVCTTLYAGVHQGQVLIIQSLWRTLLVCRAVSLTLQVCQRHIAPSLPSESRSEVPTLAGTFLLRRKNLFAKSTY